ncbi:butyrophilin-like protein 1 isoform X2 [Sander lucioperca]|uniref:butyrophilin-like protein 1 isoform X2 n=1 Tax=Sander lucioperca TaxID=283035 RepID=UPI00125D6CB2|nr:butyrophilin-like protein 1 isoform X2 [Sander lucioperca]
MERQLQNDIRKALMAPFIILLFLLSEAASDPHVLTVYPGDDVTLKCEAADVPISVVEWSRPDLVPEFILLNIDGHPQTRQQNPSYKDRVDLVDRDLKDGDVSLTLKNVNRYDSGIYECRAASLGLRRKKRAFLDSEPIRTIQLQDIPWMKTQ